MPQERLKCKQLEEKKYNLDNTKRASNKQSQNLQWVK